MKLKTLVMAVVVSAVSLAGGSALAAKKAPAKLSGVVNLNTASEKQLDALPGVGPKQAKAIVAYRATKPFARAEEIVKVKGFGKKKYEKLKQHLSIAGPSSLAVMPGEAQPQGQGRTPPPAR
jgi:competence protein ComEA